MAVRVAPSAAGIAAAENVRAIAESDTHATVWCGCLDATGPLLTACVCHEWGRRVRDVLCAALYGS